MELEPIANGLGGLDALRRRLEAKGIHLPEKGNGEEYARRRAESMNAIPGTLKGVDCAACLNRGVIYRADEAGNVTAMECKCMTARRGRRRLERSGLGDMMERYTFNTWRTPERWQRDAAALAGEYLKAPRGWMLATGRSGSGKTHLCTAVCVELMRQGVDLRYMLWREIAVKAKAVVNDPDAYAAIVNPLKNVQALYIDDFYKAGKNQPPTTGDVNLAFEILNHRYNDPRKLTIISTERSMAELMDIDEAIGGRIYERSAGHRLAFHGGNWRLRR